MAPEYMEEEFASKFTNLVNMTCERQMYLLMQSLEQIVANVLLVIVELSFITKFHHQLDKQSPFNKQVSELSDTLFNAI